MLTDFERGACFSGIEAVGLAGKPIIEIMGRYLTSQERDDLLGELNDLLKTSTVPDVKCFVEESDPASISVYGFYRHPWALVALKSYRTWADSISAEDRSWIEGLLYGYTPDAIAEWVTRKTS